SRIKWGSEFGSDGWSGEAGKMVEDKLSGFHKKLHKPSFREKLIPDDKTLKECQKFEKEFTAALKQK
nr:FprA family A-type flavoprotein [Candidatus Brocadiales bacterium]